MEPITTYINEYLGGQGVIVKFKNHLFSGEPFKDLRSLQFARETAF